MTEFLGLSTVLRQTAAALGVAAEVAGSALNAVADSLDAPPAAAPTPRPRPAKASPKRAPRGRRPRG